jgi:RNA polymerase subunit RPABC4/transcription elongation factor Spt4
MADFTEVCRFPCLCLACNAIVEANLLEKPRPVCPNCQSVALIPYDDPHLVGTVGSGVVASWNMEADLGRELVLHDGTYCCPACHSHQLSFESDGLLFD